MKKLLLLGLGLFSGVSMFAQEAVGENATPAGYEFATVSKIPWFDNGFGGNGYGFTSAANYATSGRAGKGVWVTLGSQAQEYWDANKGLMGCGFVASEEEMQKLLKGFQLVDLGGDVGQVLCWQGQKSTLKEELQSNYPEQNWDNIPAPLDQGVAQVFNLNFWLNPNDVWTKGMGYYRVRMVVNALSSVTDADIENEIYPFDGGVVLKEIYQVNNQGNNTSFIYNGEINEEGEKVNTSANDVGVVPPVTNDLFVKRNAEGQVLENEWGDPMWDPTVWAVVDYYFNVAGNADGVDENGDATVPVRIKIGTQDAFSLNSHAILIKEFSVTKFAGDLTQDIYDLNKQSFPTISLKVGGDAGVNSIEDDLNAPVEYYNLQGVKVANPENGIFIRKQGKKATKVVL